MSVTINRPQRMALYEEVICVLTGVGDIYNALDRDDPVTARRLRRRFEDVMRLLDDIGWSAADPREQFALTMSAAQLVRIAQLIGARAMEQLSTHETELAQERALRERNTLAATTCSDLVEQATSIPAVDGFQR